MAVRFEPGRVVAVWAPAAPAGMVGAGYLLGDGLVLTAGHVVDYAEGQSCEVRALGSSEWLPATRVWRGKGCDAALLRINQDQAAPEDRVARIGRIGRGERVPCRALGFP